MACLAVVRAEEDPCIALQEQMIDTYNSPECAYARTVISTSDVLAGNTPPDPAVCSKSCVAKVAQTMGGFAEHGCVVPEPAEQLSAFMYPIYEHYAEFLQATAFYCTADDCYATVRDTLQDPMTARNHGLPPKKVATYSEPLGENDTLQDPMHCNISEPLLVLNEFIYGECFRWIPCTCVGQFGTAFRSRFEFTDEFGPPSVIVEAAEKAFELGYCVEHSSTGPTTSGGTTVGMTYHLYSTMYVIGFIVLQFCA